METVTINGTSRGDMGKKSSRTLRKQGQVPCVIYGGDKTIHFASEPKAFKSLIFTPEFKLAEITVDGTAYKCILKDAQYHPVTDEIVHLDFLQLVPNKKVKVNIPVGFKGVSPGVKLGGKLIQKLRHIIVKTTPENLVDELLFDISGMELGSSIRVRDLKAIDGIEVMNSPGIPVASVEIPRSLKSAAASKEAEATAK